MTKIIAFAGKKQSGKSTAGEYVEKIIKEKNAFYYQTEGRPIKYKLYSFADPLKQNICIDLLGLSYDQCYGSDEQKNTLSSIRWDNVPPDLQHKNINNNIYLTAREVMEIVGTSILRRLKNDVWVDATMNQIKKDNLDLAIVLDTRFPNEVNKILNAGGFVIRLTRDLYKSVSDAEIALDPDRYDWKNFSLIIDNNLSDIKQKEEEIFNFIKNQGIIQL